MIIIKKISLLFLLFASSLFAQINSVLLTNQEWFKVDSIKIIGTETTKDFVILRELTFEVGDSVNSKILFFNRERVFSLGIFTRVEINRIISDNKNVVVIKIEESWYIFPVPFLIIREKTLERTSYGISFKYKNFRGRNETIRANISLGYDPFFSLEYENPLILPEHNISFAFAAAIGTPVNKSPILEEANGNEFDFEILSFSTALGKRINKQNNAFLLFGYAKIKAPISVRWFMASGENIDKKFSVGIAYLFDSRDLKQNAQKGYLFNINLTNYGMFSSKINYNILNIDFRKYNKIYKSLVLKERFTTRHAFGKFVPYYDLSRLGYDYYTRGNRYLVREGDNRVLGSLEFGIPLLNEWNFGIKLPVVPNSLTRSRIAIVASVFLDAGTTFNNNEKLVLNDFNMGYGAGITFLFLPYNSFRIEYAFNEFGKGELLLETGISF